MRKRKRHSDFVQALFTGCKAMGLHTALDSNGFLGDHLYRPRFEGGLITPCHFCLQAAGIGLKNSAEMAGPWGGT
jgi:hypothetical protein